MQKKHGFTDIILTPHYIEDYYENNYEEISPKIKELQLKLQDNGITVNIHHGNEVYISENIGDLIKNKTVATLAGSNYLLFELPQNNKILTLNALIEQIKDAGCIPVLAHPERYMFVQQNINSLKHLISEGVILQSNYGSIIGQYGKEAQKTIIKMLKNNMVHLLGTDTHRSGYIYGHFYKVENAFLKYISEEEFYQLTTINPMHILENSPIEIEQPNENKRHWFSFN